MLHQSRTNVYRVTTKVSDSSSDIPQGCTCKLQAETEFHHLRMRWGLDIELPIAGLQQTR